MITIQDQDLIQYLRTTAKLSKGTIVTRRSRIRVFTNWLRETNKSISPVTIEEFFIFLQDEKQLTNTSLNTYHHALRSLEKYLINRNHGSPFMKEFKVYSEEDPNITPLTNKEIRLLKNACLRHTTSPLLKAQYDITIFLTDTGARWEDAQILNLGSVDVIGRQISYMQLKNKLRRVLPLEEPLLSIMSRRMQGRTVEEIVFFNSVGGVLHYSDYFKFLRKLSESVGITKRVSPHILRHSYAQNFYDLTGDIYLLKDLLGHKSIKSTLRYLRNSQKRVNNAQQMHPHLAESINPQIKIDIIQKELERHGIGQDSQFDSLQVKKAINKFVINLYDAILPKPLI